MTLEQRLKLTGGFQKAAQEFVVAETDKLDKRFTDANFQTIFCKRAEGIDGEFINASVHINMGGEHKNIRLDREMERIPKEDTKEGWKDVAMCVKSATIRYWLTREEMEHYAELKKINGDVAYCVLVGEMTAANEAIKAYKLNAEQTKQANTLIKEIQKLRDTREAKGISAKKPTVFIEWTNEDKLPFELVNQDALMGEVEETNIGNGHVRNEDFGGGFIDVEVSSDYSAMFA